MFNDKSKLVLITFIIIVLIVGELFLRPGSISITTFRVPRLITAICVGVILSITGLFMQSIFKNPLAGPYLTGIIPGAQLFITIVLVLAPLGFLQTTYGNAIMQIAAIVGGTLSMLLIYSLFKRFKNMQLLLLAGVVLTYFLSGFSELILSMGNAEQIKNVVVWQFGNLDYCFGTDIWILGMGTLIAILVSLWAGSKFDIYALGNLTANNTGLNTHKFALTILVFSGIFAGLVTVFCGPVGFIGMISPQFARFTCSKQTYAYLLIFTLLYGMLFILLADVASHYLITNQQLSFNAMAAIIGAPIVAVSIFRQKYIY